MPVTDADELFTASHGIFYFRPAFPVVDIIVTNDPVVRLGTVHFQSLGDVGVPADVEIIDVVLYVGV